MRPSTGQTRQSAISTAPRRIGVVFALAVVGSVLTASPASAHAIVQRTEPGIDQVVVDRSPPAVSMLFNEPVEIAFGSLRVFDTTGRRVDEGRPEHVPGDPASVRVGLQPGLPDGTYTVAWRVISADGHPIHEAFVFHVGAPGPNPKGIGDRVLGQPGSRVTGVAYGVARWLTFASLLLLVGGGIFLVAVWRHAADRARIPLEARARFARRWRRVMVAAWVGAVVGTIASLWLQTAIVADVSPLRALGPSLLDDVATTRFGIVMLFRIGLLAALVVPWLALRSAPAAGATPNRTPIQGWPLWLAGALGIALLATPGLAGHAGSTDPVSLNLAGDALHLAAGAAWVGGLVMLLLAAFPRRPATRAPRVRRCWRRWSPASRTWRSSRSPSSS